MNDCDAHARNIEKSIFHKIKQFAKIHNCSPKMCFFFIFSPNFPGHVFRVPGASRTLQKLPRSSQNDSQSISRKLEISWKSRFFGVIPGHVLQEEIRSENRIDTTNASLDSLWPQEGWKIDPEWNEHTDFEKLDFCDQNLHLFDSHVDARFPMRCYYS